MEILTSQPVAITPQPVAITPQPVAITLGKMLQYNTLKGIKIALCEELHLIPSAYYCTKKSISTILFTSINHISFKTTKLLMHNDHEHKRNESTKGQTLSSNYT